MITVAVAHEQWALARPFRIAYQTISSIDAIVATVSDGECTGRGEGVPFDRFEGTLEQSLAAAHAAADAVRHGASRADLLATCAAGSGRNALDCALWDLESQRAGRPAWAMAGLDRLAPLPVAFTIGIDHVDEMARQAAAATQHVLKIKLDARDPVGIMRAIRQAVPSRTLIADANEGWTFEQMIDVLPQLAALGVEMVEQPLAARHDDQLVGYTPPLTLSADESCCTLDDLDHVAERYQMINIKLDKTGGLTHALALADAARARGLALMVGNMVGTSLAMAPALIIGQWCRYVDLDGPLLLASDRVPSLSFADGCIHPSAHGVWGEGQRLRAPVRGRHVRDSASPRGAARLTPPGGGASIRGGLPHVPARPMRE